MDSTGDSSVSKCASVQFLFLKGKDVTYGQVWWPILGICALHLTHPSAHTQQWTQTHIHTHSEHTHPEQWAANAAVPEEQLGVRCFTQGSHLSRGIEGGESAVHSLPPPSIPAGPVTRTHDLWVLYPLGQDCPKSWPIWCSKHVMCM